MVRALVEVDGLGKCGFLVCLGLVSCKFMVGLEICDGKIILVIMKFPF